MKLTADYSQWMAAWEKEYTLTRQLYRNVLRYADKTVVVDPFYEKTLTFRRTRRRIEPVRQCPSCGRRWAE